MLWGLKLTTLRFFPGAEKQCLGRSDHRRSAGSDFGQPFPWACGTMCYNRSCYIHCCKSSCRDILVMQFYYLSRSNVCHFLFQSYEIIVSGFYIGSFLWTFGLQVLFLYLEIFPQVLNCIIKSSSRFEIEWWKWYLMLQKFHWWWIWVNIFIGFRIGLCNATLRNLEKYLKC